MSGVAETASEASVPEAVARFIDALDKLEPGASALLRRNAGRTLAEAHGTAALFYRILPYDARWDEEIYFLVATLYRKNKRPPSGDLGTTLRELRAMMRTEAMDRRMAILLDSGFERLDGGRQGGGELAYRLRQLVRLAVSKQAGIDWAQLLTDLLWWSHPSRKVQKRWARSYFQSPPAESEPGEGGR